MQRAALSMIVLCGLFLAGTVDARCRTERIVDEYGKLRIEKRCGMSVRERPKPRCSMESVCDEYGKCRREKRCG